MIVDIGSQAQQTPAADVLDPTMESRAMAAADIHLIPSFHYDVVYLKGYEEYLRISFDNLREALRILEAAPEYTFLVEQVILLQEFWERCPEQRGALRRFADQGRLEVSPGMYVMPDMNHPDGESLFRQVEIGRAWLAEHLGLQPDCCWIADCWGHHAQLPQILTQSGYRTYFFWRCMRPEVMTNHFLWEGLDGTRLRTHWLARGYGNLRFPSTAAVLNAPDLDLRGCGPQQVRALCQELQQYGAGPYLLCNGGDFLMPQATAPAAVGALNRSGALPPVVFSTPSRYAGAVAWDRCATVTGEFNSNFQGTFTSNLAIKQRTRQGIGRALALEALDAVARRPRRVDLGRAWRLLLKQQFHDSICGTICDEALVECLRELTLAETALAVAGRRLAGRSGSACWFNGTGFARTEIVDDSQEPPSRVALAPFGVCSREQAVRLPAAEPLALPAVIETPHYRAEIGRDGYITRLVGTAGQNVVALAPCPFGSLALQMDNGDLWLNFEGPLNGGSIESALTRNLPDPYDRSQPGDLANRSTFRPGIRSATACRYGDVTEIVQQGSVGFWRIRVDIETRVRFSPSTPRIEYRTRSLPSGRHFRLRVAFPTTLRDSVIRHEIPYGIQVRGPHEHVAQNWVDLADATGGVALLNRGIPGNTVADGVLMLSLFRSAAMEYKAPSEASFNEGVPHTFEYAVMVHGPAAEAELVREGALFARPPVPLPYTPATPGAGWALDGQGAVISALRRTAERVFVRVYEATGKPFAGALRLPPGIATVARTDGLMRPVETPQPCAGTLDLTLKPFEVLGLLFGA